MLEDGSTIQNDLDRLRKYSRQKKILKICHSIKTAVKFNTWAGRINCKKYWIGNKSPGNSAAKRQLGTGTTLQPQSIEKIKEKVKGGSLSGHILCWVQDNGHFPSH